jgi:phage terminase large subunit-like protein
MGPAADTFENAVKEHDLTLDGSEALMRHLSNCIVTERRGYHVPTKSSADSPDKIDAGIGAVVSYARAMWHVLQVPDEPFVWRAV